MSDVDLLLRVATLVDEAYKKVADVVVPRTVGDWPPAIRYQGRVFTIYYGAMVPTIEAVKAAERQQLYREITVWDARDE